jgi:hypothetical protein
MGFRSDHGLAIRWENTALPNFSNFAFCEQYYRADSVLRRILSLARKLGYRSILVDEIPADTSALCAEESEALAKRRTDFTGSTVHRLTFLRSPANTAPGRNDFIGYVVFKTDLFGANLSRSHIYEAVLPPVRDAADNCFLHTQRNFDFSTSAGSGCVKGVLYAQQNDLTFVCAHVALRTVLSSVLPDGDVAYSQLNAIAGIDHASVQIGEGTDKGLSPPLIEKILQNFNIPFRKLAYEPNKGPLPPGVEYQQEIYGSIESRRPALLGFEMANDPITGRTSRHLIPVLGHTFNDDAWMPDAERMYFNRTLGYFRSEAWLSTFVVHDDNVGPYFCLPRHYLSRDSFRLLYGIQAAQASLALTEAEALAYSTLTGVHTTIPALGLPWYDRFAAYGRSESLVLRSFQIRRRRYLDHLATLKDIYGGRFPVDQLAPVEKILPDYFWMIEISAPELFPMSRQKFGEIIFPADRPLDGSSATALLIRLPGLLVVGYTPSLAEPNGYTPLMALTP